MAQYTSMSEPLSDKRRRFRKRLVFLLLLLGGAAAWVYGYYRLQWPDRFAVVDAGRLYRSAQPSTRQIEHMIGELGIKTLLIVRSGSSDRVPNEVEFANSKGLRVVHIPIESRKPIPEDQVRQFFLVVDDPASGPILVHCSAGLHRTGYLCARYRVDKQGWPMEKAIAELLSFEFNAESQGVILEQLKSYKPASRAVVGRIEN